jgi:dihydropyrimidinase
VVAGGTVADARGTAVADVAIRGERIVAVGLPGSFRDAQRVIDAAGMIVVPGGVDPHVHAATSLGDFTTLDDFVQCSTAAAWGGTTTIVDFAIPQPAGVQGPVECADLRTDLARQAVVDVAFHACVTRADERSLAEVALLAERGFPTVKVFTIYRDLVMLTLDEVYRCMQAIAMSSGVLLVHAESPDLIEPLRARCVDEGRTCPPDHAWSRPPASEVNMVRTVVDMLRLTGCRGYIVHVSVPESVRVIVEARMGGVSVWCETCPQYTFLDGEAYGGEDGELYICSPPLRPKMLARSLWDLACRGFVEVWGSDHCCYDRAQKLKYRDNFLKVPNGLPGVELRAPLLFSEGVSKGRISLPQFVAMSSTNPAKLNGLYPRKGVLMPGADADVVIYDPQREVEVAAATLHMATDYTPFDGWKISGWPVTVISRGHPVVEDGKFSGWPGWGKVLRARQPTAPWAG